MQALAGVLGKNYMYVLGKSWAVNATSFQQAMWKVFEIFIDKETAAKICFSKSPQPKDLVDSFHPSQLEIRFGGKAEHPKQYWPPIIPSNEFNEDP